jgi:hypothetical protein
MSLVFSGNVDRRPLFAAVDPSARYVTPQVCERKFAAFLCPFNSREAAVAALEAAGAKAVSEVRR